LTFGKTERPGSGRFQRPGELIEFPFRLILFVAVAILEFPGQLVPFAGDCGQVVVGQFAPLFLDLAP
jgi:hypothetical protein